VDFPASFDFFGFAKHPDIMVSNSPTNKNDGHAPLGGAGPVKMFAKMWILFTMAFLSPNLWA